MTKEEAIEVIERYKITNASSLYDIDTNKACDMAIRALKEIDSLKAEQPKHGHWIIDEYEYLDCSCCGESYYTGCDCTEDARHRLKIGDVYKFCPYCGARMDGEQDATS